MSGSKWFLLTVGVIFLLALLLYQYSFMEVGASKEPSIAFLVGSPDPYWLRVASGAKEAAKQHGAQLQVIIPKEGVEDQTIRLLTIKPEEFDGIAVSPMDPEKQTRAISTLATRTKVVTYDNDAPQSVRHCHVGTNNYVAGTLCGQLLMEALPDGGDIAVFVGDDTRENARLRRQGLIDALKRQSRSPGSELAPIDRPINAGAYTIVATYLDGSLPDDAKKNAVQAINDYPDLDAMVALYGYNGPMCLEALEEAKKLSEIKVVAFDEDERTLAGIEDGHVYASVVQSPFQYGYEAVRILVAMHQNESFVPYAGRGLIYLPCKAVKSENVEEFRRNLESLQFSSAD